MKILGYSTDRCKMALREAENDLELAKKILSQGKNISSSKSMLELKNEEKKDNLSIHSYEVSFSLIDL